MSLPVTQLFGVRDVLSPKLHAAGLHNADQLLAASAHPKDREALAAKLGIDAKQVLELANRADLARIKGIGRVYSDLLEWAGVDTVAELAKRKPDNLYDKIVEAAGEHFVKQLPTRKAVASWVEQAKGLDRKLFY